MHLRMNFEDPMVTRFSQSTEQTQSWKGVQRLLHLLRVLQNSLQWFECQRYYKKACGIFQSQELKIDT